MTDCPDTLAEHIVATVQGDDWWCTRSRRAGQLLDVFATDTIDVFVAQEAYDRLTIAEKAQIFQSIDDWCSLFDDRRKRALFAGMASKLGGARVADFLLQGSLWFGFEELEFDEDRGTDDRLRREVLMAAEAVAALPGSRNGDKVDFIQAIAHGVRRESFWLYRRGRVDADFWANPGFGDVREDAAEADSHFLHRLDCEKLSASVTGTDYVCSRWAAAIATVLASLADDAKRLQAAFDAVQGDALAIISETPSHDLRWQPSALRYVLAAAACYSEHVPFAPRARRVRRLQKGSKTLDAIIDGARHLPAWQRESIGDTLCELFKRVEMTLPRAACKG